MSDFTQRDVIFLTSDSEQFGKSKVYVINIKSCFLCVEFDDVSEFILQRFIMCQKIMARAPVN